MDLSPGLSPVWRWGAATNQVRNPPPHRHRLRPCRVRIWAGSKASRHLARRLRRCRHQLPRQCRWHSVTLHRRSSRSRPSSIPRMSACSARMARSRPRKTRWNSSIAPSWCTENDAMKPTMARVPSGRFSRAWISWFSTKFCAPSPLPRRERNSYSIPRPDRYHYRTERQDLEPLGSGRIRVMDITDPVAKGRSLLGRRDCPVDNSLSPADHRCHA